MSERNLPTTDEQDTQTTTDAAPTKPSSSGIESSASDELQVKNLDVADDESPITAVTGDSSHERGIDSDAIHEYLADRIYDSNSAFFREFAQNSETACVRAARQLLGNHPDYGQDWLTTTLRVNAETGETVEPAVAEQKLLGEWSEDDVREIDVPRPLSEVFEAARDVGYDPTIEVNVHYDERKIVWRDNGIGMTVEEAIDAFNVTGKSGVRGHADTGGMLGQGALTFKNMAGDDGDMIVTTGTRLSVDGPNGEPFAFTAYLGGMDELPNDVPDDFRGTRFEVPVQDSVDMSNFRDWMEDYCHLLRVPVLYKEHRGGEVTFEEEYGGTTLRERFDDPAVQIHRPGEFSVVAGPDVGVRSNDPESETYLISMKIDRNVHTSINSLWNGVVQIHDEQNRVIAGPNRGKYADELDSLHPDDVTTPSPTADRDRLEKNQQTKDFFREVSDLVRQEELSRVADIADEIKEADRAGDPFRGEYKKWRIFYRMVSKHGPYKVTERNSKFKRFLTSEDQFPDYDDDTIESLFRLFNEVQVAEKDYRDRIPTQKKNMENRRLGEVVAETPGEKVFMAASTSEVFRQRGLVIHNTFDDPTILRLDTASQYDTLSEQHDFRLVKDVPRTQSDEHEFDVPNKVVSKKNQTESNDDDSNGKPDDVTKQELALRYDSSTKSIDSRTRIERIKTALDSGAIHGKPYLVLFPLGGEHSLTDNTQVQDYAAIASTTNEQTAALTDHERVYTYDEFCDYTASVTAETRDGSMTPAELLADDRMVILAYGYDNKADLLGDSDVSERFATLVAREARDERYWGSTDRPDDDEMLVGVMPDEAYRFAHGVRQESDRIPNSTSLMLARLTTVRPSKWYGSDQQLSADYDVLWRKARTPEWSNNKTGIYKLASDRHAPGFTEDLLFGLHDAGLDLGDVDGDDLQDKIAALDL